MTRKRILIVDDNSELRKLVRLTLELEDYALHEAQSADECLPAVRALDPDLVLLDVMTPGTKDGLEACLEINQSDLPRKPIVVLLTARGQQTDVAKGLAAGAAAYVVKPFSPAELAATVKRLLQPRG